jgi:hypothetical protein
MELNFNFEYLGAKGAQAVCPHVCALVLPRQYAKNIAPAVL